MAGSIRPRVRSAHKVYGASRLRFASCLPELGTPFVDAEGIILVDADGLPELASTVYMKAAEESGEAIASDSHRVSITAGMGRGIGSSAAPVVAQISKEADYLAVLLLICSL